MKKYLALACAFSCAAALTACHDDDDDDDSDYVSDFTSINKVSYVPGVQTAANQAGLDAFLLSDSEGKTDIACYMYSGMTIGDTVIIDEEWFDNFYGGFCPTAFTADDESYDPYRPITGSYHSGSGALVCNTGTLCRALYFRRHFGVDMSSALSNLFLGDMEKMYVCPTAQYKKLTTSDGLTELGISSSPANIQIRFYVYGYIKSLSLSSWTAVKEMLKTNIKDSDVKSSSYAVLAETDANGNWSVASDWVELDLSDIEDYYVFECAMQVVDKTTGKSVSTFSIDDGTVDGGNKLNYCIVDDVTVENKSIF